MYLLELARKRRSVRSFSGERVPLNGVLYALKVALEAPSGANQQPWEFVIVNDPEIKEKIRVACERAEKKFHNGVRGELASWLKSRRIGWEKPFLTEAPYLIAVFATLGKPYSIQSTWISIGYLLLALEEVGLASLTYTPPNPREIGRILGAPRDAVLQTIIPVGRERGFKPKEPRLSLKEKVHINAWGSLMGIPDPDRIAAPASDAFSI